MLVLEVTLVKQGVADRGVKGAEEEGERSLKGAEEGKKISLKGAEEESIIFKPPILKVKAQKYQTSAL